MITDVLDTKSAVLVAAITLTLCVVIERIQWWLNPLRKSKIPKVPHLIPWLGSADAFLNDTAQFASKWAYRLKSPVFTAYIAGMDHIFITEASLMNAAFSGRYPLTWEHVKYRINSLWGVYPSSAFTLARARGNHKVFDKYLMNTGGLEKIMSKYQRILNERVNPYLLSKIMSAKPSDYGKGGNKEWAVSGIFDLFYGAVFRATVEAFYDDHTLASDEMFERTSKMLRCLHTLLILPRFVIRLFFNGKCKELAEIGNLFERKIGCYKMKSKDGGNLLQDLFNYYESLFDDGTMDTEERWRIMLVPLMASLFNTGPTVFWTVYYILADEVVYSAVKKEIMSIVHDNSCNDNDNDNNSSATKTNVSFTLADLNKMQVLDAIISETLRLKSTMRTVRMRTAVADFNMKLKVHGETKAIPVKKGTLVHVPMALLHNDAQVFKNPDTFIYDRFLPVNGKPPVFTKNGEIIPNPVNYFGMGLSYCPGRKLAVAEIKLVIASIFHKYDVRFLGGVVPEKSPKVVNETRRTTNMFPLEDAQIEIRPCD
eukprot:CAMPEP_0172513248 /NCGR_PEP_ID=MMETSP1066-20121228/251066_1 /TAXON_ID=671091 /ORGANISM="Coscinodiscus wailesii, Strain CCMP2513" /LENGTH=539 /DNA_ID=CAMNT_0013293439 /DNA_START=90 /DNA_END=1709 /DNA_ORIENTATION=-